MRHEFFMGLFNLIFAWLSASLFMSNGFVESATAADAAESRFGR